MCRLDRVLCTADWEAIFPACALNAASTSVSDHYQLLLTGDSSAPRNRRFRFESFWFGMPGITDVVKTAWGRLVGSADKITVLHTKQVRMAKAIRRWAGDIIGDMRMQSAIATDIVHR